MIPVSVAWAEALSGPLAPEGFVKLSCYIPELQETLVYTKQDLMSFTHRQTACLVSGELPKNWIEFSLDNSDGKWNPSNPAGLERYLSERLQITLHYGFDINGTVEWIQGGVFYLSEWRTSLNGLEAHFVARDMLEYMIDKPFVGEDFEDLAGLSIQAVEEAELPNGVEVDLDQSWTYHQLDRNRKFTGEESIAEVLQKCCNATCSIMFQDRLGVLRTNVMDYDNFVRSYTIPLNLSYQYPEIEYTKPIKAVSVTYENNQSVLHQISSTGETQTVTNDFITAEFQAIAVAEWVYDSLRSRRKISGSFRGDLRMELFDIVSVESKYGVIPGVVITDIKHTFNGGFRTEYSGYIRGSNTSVFVFCNEVYTGEVI